MPRGRLTSSLRAKARVIAALDGTTEGRALPDLPMKARESSSQPWSAAQFQA